MVKMPLNEISSKPSTLLIETWEEVKVTEEEKTSDATSALADQFFASV